MLQNYKLDLKIRKHKFSDLFKKIDEINSEKPTRMKNNENKKKFLYHPLYCFTKHM